MSKFLPDVIILNSNEDIDPKKLHGQFHDDTSKHLTFRVITSKKFTDGQTDGCRTNDDDISLCNYTANLKISNFLPIRNILGYIQVIQSIHHIYLSEKPIMENLWLEKHEIMVF